jgi:hypothetical protein
LWCRRRTITPNPELNNAGIAIPGTTKSELPGDDYREYKSAPIEDPIKRDFHPVAVYSELDTAHRRQELLG